MSVDTLGARTTGGKQFIESNFELLQKIGREQVPLRHALRRAYAEMEPPPVVYRRLTAWKLQGPSLRKLRGSATSILAA